MLDMHSLCQVSFIGKHDKVDSCKAQFDCWRSNFDVLPNETYRQARILKDSFKSEKA